MKYSRKKGAEMDYISTPNSLYLYKMKQEVLHDLKGGYL